MLKLNWLGGLLCLVGIVIGLTSAKKNNSVKNYINKYHQVAVSEMKRSGIPASITLAQGILESSSGGSYLTRKANNHFGIKCHSSWKGKRVYAKDDRKDDCFRHYGSAKESFKDHTNFLVRNSRYNFLFKAKNSNYKFWAEGLRKAGYATDKKYAKSLIAVIKRYDLAKYDEWLKKNKVSKPKVASSSNKTSSTKTKTPPPSKKTTTSKPKTPAPKKAIITKVSVEVKNGTKTCKFDKDVSLKQVAAVFKLTDKEIATFNSWKTSDIVQAGTTVKLQHPKEKLPFWKQLSDIGAWANLYGIKDKLLGKKESQKEPIVFEVSLTEDTATKTGNSSKKKEKKTSDKGEKKVTEKTVPKAATPPKPSKKAATQKTVQKEKKKEVVKTKTTKNSTSKSTTTDQQPQTAKKETEKTTSSKPKTNTKEEPKTAKKEEAKGKKEKKVATKLTRVQFKAKTKIHTVKAGENLYRIARKYGMTVKQLKANNQLTSNKLDINQKLTVNI